MKYAMFVVALGLGGAVGMRASADVLVSNLAEPMRDASVLNALDWAAQSFETDGSEYTLMSISAIVGDDTGVGAFAELRASDINGNLDPTPAGLITTFTVPDLSGPFSTRVFTPDSVVRLAAGTRYFFVLGGSGPGEVQWSYAEGNGSTGPGTLAQYEYTFDGGLTWSSYGIKNPFHLEVEVSNPEVLVSNLTEPQRAINVLDADDWAAQSFETDARTYTLTSIAALVGVDTGAGVFAELRASDVNGDMDTTPAGLLATFTVPDLTGPIAPQVFLPESAVALAASTRYYFMLGATSAGQFEWSYAEGNASIGPGFLSQYQYSFDGGQTWTVFGSDNPFHIEVLALVGAGCYADCDPSTGPGVLDIFDFLCFGNSFANGEPYACDCDTSTGVGVCDIFDFLCFGNAFSAGCP